MDEFSSVMPLVVLAEKFASLPGIGMKTAQRLAFSVMGMTTEQVQSFAEALVDVKEHVHECTCCCNLAEHELCAVCSNPKRDPSVICVVESPQDVTAIERTHQYHGMYHVLHGLISPLDGISPEQLRVKELLHRVNAGGVEELIMATNPSVTGEATAMYLARLFKPLNVKVTRLALGMPVGGFIEFTDEVTLYRALSNRSEI